MEVGGRVVPLLPGGTRKSMSGCSGRLRRQERRQEPTRTWKRTMSSWLLAMKLLSRTPRLNQLPRQRNTLMNIFSSLPVFSTQDVCNTAKVRPRPSG